jgi:hypothetical protein
MHVKAMKIHWVDKVLSLLLEIISNAAHTASHQIMMFCNICVLQISIGVSEEVCIPLDTDEFR